MTTPMRPVPDAVLRWIDRRRWLRWADGVLAWALLWLVGGAMLAPTRLEAAAVVCLIIVVVAGAMVQPLRVRWRPISAWVGLRLSRGLRPGERAWYVSAREAHLVVITARHRVRLVIVRPDVGQDEGISVRCTRVFLLPADGP
jgi:hypothetical protein